MVCLQDMVFQKILKKGFEQYERQQRDAHDIKIIKENGYVHVSIYPYVNFCNY